LDSTTEHTGKEGKEVMRIVQYREMCAKLSVDGTKA